MIIFIYGEEQYLSLQRLLTIKQKYVDSNLGDTNMVEFDPRNFSIKRFEKEIMTTPFLAKKRLIIMKDFLKKAKSSDLDKIEKLILKIPPTTIILFYEAGVPDKRKKMFKILSKQKTAKEYKKLSRGQLINWVKKRLDEIVKDKRYLKSGFVEKIISLSSTDMFKLENQIEKIGLYLNSGLKLNKQDLLKLVSTDRQADIFFVIEQIVRKNTTDALEGIHKFIENGENELYLLTMIVFQFRNMLIVKDYLEKSQDKNPNNFSLAKKIKLHPFVIKKILEIIDNFSLEELKKIYQKLFELDCQIKNGLIEPEMALDKFIVETTQNR